MSKNGDRNAANCNENFAPKKEEIISWKQAPFNASRVDHISRAKYNITLPRSEKNNSPVLPPHPQSRSASTESWCIKPREPNNTGSENYEVERKAWDYISMFWKCARWLPDPMDPTRHLIFTWPNSRPGIRAKNIRVIERSVGSLWTDWRSKKCACPYESISFSMWHNPALCFCLFRGTCSKLTCQQCSNTSWTTVLDLTEGFKQS